jgi:hypothetical protein
MLPESLICTMQYFVLCFQAHSVNRLLWHIAVIKHSYFYFKFRLLVLKEKSLIPVVPSLEFKLQ